MELTRCFACMQELDSPGGVCPHCGFDNTKGLSGQPAHALPCGSVLAGHYLVGKVLGQGGFGITYIGWNLSLEMPVCIKEYFPAGAAMRSASQSSCVLWGGGESAAELKRGRESFVKEARKAVKLSDLGSVVKVWDVFYENETAYIVMNYLEGETLKSWLVKRGKPLDEKSCFAFLEPVMRELDEVHKRGIIHRDIKPDNLMLRSDGKLVLLDLGAAKDLSGGSGQSSYMVASQGFSPMEQYRAHGEIGPWTDVYAMCATFYYCVSGKLPPTPMDRAEGVKPDMDAFSPAVAAVLGKGLALHSKDRIQSMSELSSLLHEALQFSSRKHFRDTEAGSAKARTGAQRIKTAADIWIASSRLDACFQRGKIHADAKPCGDSVPDRSARSRSSDTDAGTNSSTDAGANALANTETPAHADARDCAHSHTGTDSDARGGAPSDYGYHGRGCTYSSFVFRRDCRLDNDHRRRALL